jgi:hypothetical protein
VLVRNNSIDSNVSDGLAATGDSRPNQPGQLDKRRRRCSAGYSTGANTEDEEMDEEQRQRRFEATKPYRAKNPRSYRPPVCYK